jgi:NadR type nicotinamide-nucleotide adenylyltransferase
MIKIVLTGSESTGKTDLAQQLGAYFHAPVAAEFVRIYAAQRDGKIEFEDHWPIARGQMDSEDAAIERAGELVILDTDLVSTLIYCEHYFGRCPAWIAGEARTRAADLYLLLATDVPWLPDGIRDRGDRRDEMHSLFRQKLLEMNLKYIEITGDREQRFKDSVAAIRRILRPLGFDGLSMH